MVYPDSGAPSTNDHVVLEWTNVPASQSYDYEVDTSPNFNSSSKISGSASDSKFATEGLTHGEMYHWRVRSVISTSPSAWSNTWVFTVGSDGVGVNEELRDDQLRVYPNPTSNNFIIETPTNVKSAEVDLVGIDGRVIQSLSWTSLSPARKIEFDASSIPTGTYILRVSSENRTFSTTVSVVK